MGRKNLGHDESRGFLKNTFIIWGRDHGDGQADHYHWRKGFPYQFSANVPMIFRWPDSYAARTPRGSVSPLVTELRDVFPNYAGRRWRYEYGSSWPQN